MNVKYYVDPKGSHLVFDLAAENCKELFALVAEVQEIFEADTSCGQCGAAELRYRVRTVDGNDFYELLCSSCQATLALGQTKDGKRLFPKRDKSKTRGWRPAYVPQGQPEYAGR